jgi:hypothetical protein
MSRASAAINASCSRSNSNPCPDDDELAEDNVDRSNEEELLDLDDWLELDR